MINSTNIPTNLKIPTNESFSKDFKFNLNPFFLTAKLPKEFIEQHLSLPTRQEFLNYIQHSLTAHPGQLTDIQIKTIIKELPVFKTQETSSTTTLSNPPVCAIMRTEQIFNEKIELPLPSLDPQSPIKISEKKATCCNLF
jgi:hypothetical protein